MDETPRTFTIKDLLIRLILIVIFVFLLIWLFPMPDLKPLNNQIFADNLDRMKNAAKSYYTVERLPQNINDSKKMTLKEMINNKMILPLMDSKGNYCSNDKSYVEITKLENEYIIKSYLSCSDKEDFVIEHFGCYDICTDTCKMLDEIDKQEEQTPTATPKKTTKKTTAVGKVTTTQNAGKIYEYLFVKEECSQKFDKYICPSGYALTGDSCIKKGSKTVRTDAKKNVEKVTKNDVKDAQATITDDSKIVDASCNNKTVTSTINANVKNQTVGAIATEVTKKLTADKVTKKDVKGAVATTVTTNANYVNVEKYSIITATKYAKTSWVYDYEVIDTASNLAYVNDNEKLVYIRMETYPTCATCLTTVDKYIYYHYNKKTEYSYSCDNFPGYSLYDGNKCRKKTDVTKKCPDGFEPNGSVCSKKTTTYSCASYGSGYVQSSDGKTCTKTTTSYKCSVGTADPSDSKYCITKQTTYSCPTGTTSIGDNKCSKTVYECPTSTSDKTYTLSGSKCIVKSSEKVCSCPSGTEDTNDQTKCVKKNSKTTYNCDKYPGYSLDGDKCKKTTTEEKVTWYCAEKDAVLDGQTCIKTVDSSDTKKAEKDYKTSCDQKYKWSTKTSIDGWGYTGQKRQIN